MNADRGTGRWFDDPAAQLLLESRIPARVAWTGPDGAPRIAPMWFAWDGARFVLAAFAGAAKLRALTRGTAVALCIDSQDFPYRSLNVRGLLDDVSEQPGLVPEYRDATVRYLGPDTAERWFGHLGAGCRQVRLSVAPQAVTVADMARDSSFLARPPRPRGDAIPSHQE